MTNNRGKSSALVPSQPCSSHSSGLKVEELILIDFFPNDHLELSKSGSNSGIYISTDRSMEVYFVSKGDNSRGRPITAPPTVIKKDLCQIPSGELKLKTKNDLDHLRSIAEDRKQWRRLSANIQEATEVSKSEQ